MDIFLLLVSGIFMLLGIAGSFLPVLPGPLTSWIGLLILHLTDAVPLSWIFLIITLIIAVLILVLDYIIPALGTKKFGGSKAGVIGTTLGLLVALFFPIFGFFGIIIWPFVGALVGELLNRTDSDKVVKAALGSFIGFLTGTFLKFITAIIFLGIYIKDLIAYWQNFM